VVELGPPQHVTHQVSRISQSRRKFAAVESGALTHNVITFSAGFPLGGDLDLLDLRVYLYAAKEGVTNPDPNEINRDWEILDNATIPQAIQLGFAGAQEFILPLEQQTGTRRQYLNQIYH
jgi:hypothetical protein